MFAVAGVCPGRGRGVGRGVTFRSECEDAFCSPPWLRFGGKLKYSVAIRAPSLGGERPLSAWLPDTNLEWHGLVVVLVAAAAAAAAALASCVFGGARGRAVAPGTGLSWSYLGGTRGEGLKLGSSCGELRGREGCGCKG